jgi:RND family efflux transporter MFP subunit
LNKRIYLLLFLVGLAALIAVKLYFNKKELIAETALSKAVRKYVPVRVCAPTMESLGTNLETDGIFLPIKEMFVISETAGRVLEVYKNKGEWVTEGDLIAKVDDELLRIELEATQANLAKMRKDQERLGNLIEGEAVAKNKMEDIVLGIMAAEAKEKALKKQISNTSIKAPMTGTLGLRFIERGSVIGPGIQVGQITNLEKLYLMVKVTERDVLNIKKGQIVAVKPDVYANTQLNGKVTNIGLRADNTFSYDVEIETPNPSATPLRAGMHARAVFSFGLNRKGLTLPRKAIAGSLQDSKVFVIQDSVAHLTTVSLGGVHGDKVEVLSGLLETDRVVLTGQLNLTNGSKVEVIQEKQ